MLGRTIKTKVEHHSAIKAHIKSVQAAADALGFANTRVLEARAKMWDMIHEIYPETKGYGLTLDNKTLELSFMSVLENDLEN